MIKPVHTSFKSSAQWKPANNRLDGLARFTGTGKNRGITLYQVIDASAPKPRAPIFAVHHFPAGFAADTHREIMTERFDRLLAAIAADGEFASLDDMPTRTDSRFRLHDTVGIGIFPLGTSLGQAQSRPTSILHTSTFLFQPDKPAESMGYKIVNPMGEMEMPCSLTTRGHQLTGITGLQLSAEEVQHLHHSLLKARDHVYQWSQDIDALCMPSTDFTTNAPNRQVGLLVLGTPGTHGIGVKPPFTCNGLASLAA